MKSGSLTASPAFLVDSDDEHEAPPPTKKRRGLAGTILDTSISRKLPSLALVSFITLQLSSPASP
jgi:hypothetical protein